MKEIQLTQGKVALVDDEDHAWLMQWKWHALANKKGTTWYALRATPRDAITRKQKIVRMHRVITNAPDGLDVDHENGDGLNNQKYNLRVCTPVENARNQRYKKPGASSKFRGVSWDRRKELWQATLRFQGHTKFLGYFLVEEAAARAFDNGAVRYHGEFASLNFPRVITLPARTCPKSALHRSHMTLQASVSHRRLDGSSRCPGAVSKGAG